MRKGAATREAILDEALRQAAQVGLEGLSLGPLADRLNLSKSGLYAHFGSKEALQIAVLDEASSRFRRRVGAPALKQPRGAARLRALFEGWLDWMDGKDATHGCVFSPASQEFIDRPGPVRDRLVEIQTEWTQALARAAAEGVEAGAFRRDLDAAQFAFEMVALGLGFQQRAKLFRAPDARQRAAQAFARRLADAAA